MHDFENLEPFECEVYDKNVKTAYIYISADRKTVKYKRFTQGIRYLVPYAFDNPTLEQLYDFLESRCMDKRRTQLPEYLKLLGLDEYNPYEIVKITHGTMMEDFMWLKFPNENITWEDVKLRD